QAMLGQIAPRGVVSGRKRYEAISEGTKHFAPIETSDRERPNPDREALFLHSQSTCYAIRFVHESTRSSDRSQEPIRAKESWQNVPQPALKPASCRRMK